MSWWRWRSWRRVWPFDRRRRGNRSAVAQTFPRKHSAGYGRTHMPCFDDLSPSSRLLIEVHRHPGEIVHTMDVSLPELPASNIQPWVRVRTNRQTGEILCSAAGRVLEDEDGA